jgi:putative chitinase
MRALLDYTRWKKLYEASFEFDADANYPDPTFGLPTGPLDSGEVTKGGVGGDWDGSMQRALAFAKIANEFMGKNVISSQKRSRVKTASGEVSDHYSGQDSTYAIDLSCSGKEGDDLLAHLMEWFGEPQYKGGEWANFTKDGYRYQIGWKVKDHFDHIHIGVKKEDSTSNRPKINKQEFINKWISDILSSDLFNNVRLHKKYLVSLSKSDISELSSQFNVDSNTFEKWINGKMDDSSFLRMSAEATFDKSSNGNATLSDIANGKALLRLGSSGNTVLEIQKKLKEKGALSKEPDGTFDEATKNAIINFQKLTKIRVDGIVGPQTYSKLYGTQDSSQALNIVSGKIKHGYTGEAANNINLLISEMEKAGIVNPYSQIGILSVIGKESGFIPKSENLNYSKERLPEVWGIFSKTGKAVSAGAGASAYNDLAVEYEHNPEKLANFVYGQKPDGMLDNAYGNTQYGDGWKYRGRGFNQLTFKGNYETYSKLSGIDLVTNPDVLNDVNTAAKVAILFLSNSLKSNGIDPNKFGSSEEAVREFARANAGWGANASTAIAKAEKIKSNFDVVV